MEVRSKDLFSATNLPQQTGTKEKLSANKKNERDLFSESLEKELAASREPKNKSSDIPVAKEKRSAKKLQNFEVSPQSEPNKPSPVAATAATTASQHRGAADGKTAGTPQTTANDKTPTNVNSTQIPAVNQPPTQSTTQGANQIVAQHLTQGVAQVVTQADPQTPSPAQGSVPTTLVDYFSDAKPQPQIDERLFIPADPVLPIANNLLNTATQPRPQLSVVPQSQFLKPDTVVTPVGDEISRMFSTFDKAQISINDVPTETLNFATPTVEPKVATRQSGVSTELAALLGSIQQEQSATESLSQKFRGTTTPIQMQQKAELFSTQNPMPSNIGRALQTEALPTSGMAPAAATEPIMQQSNIQSVVTAAQPAQPSPAQIQAMRMGLAGTTENIQSSGSPTAEITNQLGTEKPFQNITAPQQKDASIKLETPVAILPKQLDKEQTNNNQTPDRQNSNFGSNTPNESEKILESRSKQKKTAGENEFLPETAPRSNIDKIDSREITTSKPNPQFEDPDIMSRSAMTRATQAAARLQAQGGGTARIQLNDSRLGAIDLRVSISSGNNVHIEIKSKNDKLRSSLEDRMGDLRDSLNTHKLNLAECKVVSDVNSARNNTENRSDSRPDAPAQQKQANTSSNDSNAQQRENGRDANEIPFAPTSKPVSQRGTGTGKKLSPQTNVQRDANGSLKILA